MSDDILPIGDFAANFNPNPMVIHHGRGPEDARCKTCRHIIAEGYNRTYYKCARRGVTLSAATDHRLKWQACRLYEQEVAT